MSPPIPSRMQLDTVGGIAKATFDLSEHGGAVGSIPIELELPAGAIIHRGFVDVVTAPTSGGSATIALNFIGSGTQAILSATAIASVTGVLALTANTTPVKVVSTTGKAKLNVTVATAALTAGKFNVYLQYFGV